MRLDHPSTVPHLDLAKVLHPHQIPGVERRRRYVLSQGQIAFLSALIALSLASLVRRVHIEGNVCQLGILDKPTKLFNLKLLTDLGDRWATIMISQVGDLLDVESQQRVEHDFNYWKTKLSNYTKQVAQNLYPNEIKEVVQWLLRE